MIQDNPKGKRYIEVIYIVKSVSVLGVIMINQLTCLFRIQIM